MSSISQTAHVSRIEPKALRSTMMGMKLDLTGEVFGKLTALREGSVKIGRTGIRSSTWVCKCECGKEATVDTHSLRKGCTRSCGCLLRPDLTGQIFGQLTVIRSKEWRGAPAWECLCICGNKTFAPTAWLNGGLKKSCGCLQEKLRHQGPNLRHGDTVGGRSPEHKIWSGMLQRCTNSSCPSYAEYGGSGIRVCERWMVFENFLEDMGRKPSPAHSLDRYPNNAGNYEPGNCRWATRTEQARNTKATLFVDFRGSRVTLRELADRYGIKYLTLYGRVVLRGWDLENAVTTSVGLPGRRKAPIDLKRAQNMRSGGMSWIDIGNEFGVSAATVYHRLTERRR